MSEIDIALSTPVSVGANDYAVVRRGAVAPYTVELVAASDLAGTAPTFSTRAEAITYIGSASVSDGATLTINGMAFRKSAGATDIADMPDWLPVWPVRPDHFAENTTPGTTDMVDAIEAAVSYVGSGGSVFGSGSSYAVSRPVDAINLSNRYFISLKLVAIGTWTSTEPLVDLRHDGSGTWPKNVQFHYCEFEGSFKASGVAVSYTNNVRLSNCSAHGVQSYAVKSTESATELLIEDCKFVQFNGGDSGWTVEANRTAKLIWFHGTTDQMVVDTVCAVALQGVALTADGGNWPTNNRFVNCHFWDIGYTPASGNSIGVYSEALIGSFIGCVWDGCALQIDAYRLQGGGAMNVTGALFGKGAGVGTNGLLFITSSGTPDLDGFTMRDCMVFDYAAADFVLFTGSFAATKKWHLDGVRYGDGTTPTGMPLIQWRDKFTYDTTAGLVTSNPVMVNDTLLSIAQTADTTKKVRLLGSGAQTTGTTQDFYFPATGGNVITDSGSNTFTSSAVKIFHDVAFLLADDGDATKKAQFQLSGVTTGTTRTITIPDKNGTMAMLSDITGGVSDGDKGDVVVSSSGSVWSLDYTAVNATIAPVWANITSKPAAVTALSGTNTGDQTITLTGDVTGSGTGSFAATIGANKVTLSQMATLATSTILGRVTAGTGNVEALTATQAKSVLAITNADVSGLGSLATASSVSLTTQATGTLQAAQMPALTGDVTTTAGSLTTAIGANKVTLSQMATLATSTFLGRTTAGTGNVEALTATQATALLDVANTTTKGLVPAPGTATGKVLDDSLSWISIPGGGDAVKAGTNDFSGTNTFRDTLFFLNQVLDTTKKVRILGNTGQTTGTTIDITLPSTSAVMARTDAGQTFIGTQAIPSLNLSLQSIATAAGTTTLTSASVYHTIFTGATTQTVVLPAATTLANGHRYKISNNSTGVVTVQTNGGATLWTLGASTDIELALTDNSTAAGTWEKDYRVGNAATGKVMTVNNSITLAGTDATTMTFPAASDTVMGLGATQTITGAKDINDNLFTLNLNSNTARKVQFSLTQLSANGTYFLYPPDASGVIGLVPWYAMLNSDYTLTSSTSEQKLFNVGGSSGGALTIGAGYYELECLLYLTGMSATSGNAKFGILGAGSATLANIGYMTLGNESSAPTTTVGAYSGGISVTSVSPATNMATAGTATGGVFRISGRFQVSASGTIIPSITLTTAAAAVVKAGSYFRATFLGTNATNGTWT